MFKFLSVLFAITIVFTVLAGILLARYPIRDAYLPWKRISVNDEINLFTELKIARLKNDYMKCKNFFEESDVSYREVKDRVAGSCKLTNQIQIEKSLYPYSATVKGQCGLMAAVAIWEKHIVGPLAEEYLSSPVSRITHYGIFSCRNIRGSLRRLSQHASANAIDVAGFELSNGEKVSVLKDWNRDTNEGLFLRELFNQSCSVFKGNLGPNYNAAHKDHFHFDLGPYRICR